VTCEKKKGEKTVGGLKKRKGLLIHLVSDFEGPAPITSPIESSKVPGRKVKNPIDPERLGSVDAGNGCKKRSGFLYRERNMSCLFV